MPKKITFFFKKIVLPFFILGISFALIGSVGVYFYIKTHTETVKNFIVKEMETIIGYDVEIGSIEANWNLTNPSITVHNYQILNANLEKSLGAEQIDIDFSWLSLVRLEPTLDKITLYRPNMSIVKEKDGTLTINGISFDYDEDGGGFSNWLLNQDDVIIVDASFTWVDLTRGDNKLEFHDVDINYGSSKIYAFVGRREFSLSSFIAPGTSEKISISGYFDLQEIDREDEIDSEIDIVFSNFNLPALKPWIDYPVDINSGFGDLNITTTVKNGIFYSLAGRVEIENLNILSENNKTIKINKLESFLNVLNENNILTVTANDATLGLDNGLNLDNFNFQTKTRHEELIGIILNLDSINLASLSDLAQYLPEDFNTTKQDLTGLAPSGGIENLKLEWNQGDSFFAGLNLEMLATNLTVKAYKNYPGIENFSGHLNIQDNTGQIKVNANNFVLSKLDTFRENIKFNELKGILTWNNDNFFIKNISANNSDFEAIINGRYIASTSDEDAIDIRIDIPRADISDLKEYYPKQMGKDALSWLDTSLLKGVAKDTKINMRGKLRDFPFIDEKNQPDASEGVFTITTTIVGSEIEYGDNWPNATNFNVDVNLNASRIELTSAEGEILGNQFKSFKGIIPNFTDDIPMLNIDAELNSPLDIIIKFINNSPIKNEMQGTSEGMKGFGPGSLKLSLKIPLTDVDKLTYDGIYSFQNSSLENETLDLPLLSEIRGDLFFNPVKVSITNAKASVYDESLNISLSNINEKTVLDVDGLIHNNLIKTKLGEKWLDKVQGETKWNAQLIIDDKQSIFTLKSDLKGVSIKSLEGFNKTAEQAIPFQLIKKSPKTGKDFIDISYGNIVTAKLERDTSNTIHHGYIGINAKPELPKQGVALFANFKEINSEDFEFIFEEDPGDKPTTTSRQALKEEFDPLIDSAVINIEHLIFEGNSLTQSSFNFYPTPTGYELDVLSNEAIGEITFEDTQNYYKANFSKIHLKKDEDSNEQETEVSKENTNEITNTLDEHRQLSKIELNIASFKINETDYGKVVLQGHEDIEGFVFNKLNITTKDYSIDGSGYWKSEVEPQKTSINFKWTIKDIGLALTSLGYPNLINKGEATIDGLVTWDDRPSNFDAEDFYGNFALIAKKGSVQKIEPGVAGRLVGLISLQNLPRRLTLDFSDLFEEGLPFDRIQSKETIINKGILSSSLFEVQGPSADIKMNGSVDFIKETQDMRVTIQPKISDTITAGALVGGPLAAAVAFVAQKILDDPFNKITTAEYHVTGTWQDPKEKIIDTKVDNFLEEEIMEPTGEVLKGTGEVIDNYLIQPTEDVIDFLFEPRDTKKTQ